MKTLAWLATVVVLSGISRAADPMEKSILSEAAVRNAEPKILDVMLAAGSKDEPTTKFSSDTPKIRALWKGKRLDAGDRVQVLWLAEDVGIDAPKESKITQSAVTAYKSDDSGVFALKRPQNGWPIGKYRVELYLNRHLMQFIDFTIEKGATIEIGREDQ